MMKIPMRVIRDIRLSCGRLRYRRGTRVRLDPHNLRVQNWIEDGYLEADLHEHSTATGDGKRGTAS